MEAILKFNLPEERSDFDDAVNGQKYKIALFEIDQFLRAIYKYGDQKLEGKEYGEVSQYIRDELREIINGYNLDIEG